MNSVTNTLPTTQAPAVKAQPDTRSAYKLFRSIGTRWSDNDAYGHVNNVVYYSWFDTAVNAWLIEQGVLDIHHGDTIGLVIETHCNYFESLAFPQTVEAGLRIARLGTSSVRYEIGLFAQGAETAAAQGHFVHVYVNKQSRRPVPLPDNLRALLQTQTIPSFPRRRESSPTPALDSRLRGNDDAV